MKDIQHDDIAANQLFDAVRQHAGEEGVKALMKAKGGVVIYLPAEPKPGHWLLKLLGDDKGTAVCRSITVTNADGRKIGMRRINIPMGEKSNRARTRSEVLRLKAKGQSAISIALQVGVHERTVRRIFADARKARA